MSGDYYTEYERLRDEAAKVKGKGGAAQRGKGKGAAAQPAKGQSGAAQPAKGSKKGPGEAAQQ